MLKEMLHDVTCISQKLTFSEKIIDSSSSSSSSNRKFYKFDDYRLGSDSKVRMIEKYFYPSITFKVFV